MHTLGNDKAKHKIKYGGKGRSRASNLNQEASLTTTRSLKGLAKKGFSAADSFPAAPFSVSDGASGSAFQDMFLSPTRRRTDGFLEGEGKQRQAQLGDGGGVDGRRCGGCRWGGGGGQGRERDGQRLRIRCRPDGHMG